MLPHRPIWQKIKPHIDYFVNMQDQLDRSLPKLQEQAETMFMLVAKETHPDR
jgi:hypothetical protein